MKDKVKRFIDASIHAGRTEKQTIFFAAREGEDFGKAVEDAIAKNGFKPSNRNAMRLVYAETQKLRRKRLKELGFKPLSIPGKPERVKTAIQQLINHVDAGKKPSAFAAANQSGLDEQQRKKLAYRVPVKKEAVQAAVDLQPGSPYVQQLLQDAGLSGLVINGHLNLSKLADVLTNTHRSLAERVSRLEAAVALLAGEQDAQSQILTEVTRNSGNQRGAWHAQALALRERGRTGNQIARLLGKTPNAVEKLLRRKGQQLRAE